MAPVEASVRAKPFSLDGQELKLACLQERADGYPASCDGLDASGQVPSLVSKEASVWNREVDPITAGPEDLEITATTNYYFYPTQHTVHSAQYSRRLSFHSPLLNRLGNASSSFTATSRVSKQDGWHGPLLSR